ncbi:hypothetical protein [Paraburkholderia bryophila]|uniref:Uncharacterized protein n=1 Tax=Paraburkholderia bryophila TaxID=420952 RepID=A0A7Z0BB43_9BURK|nr:hypothetical protein [Paraburkholderia bryophila]NYH26047.1 hypothetical protein [Paraburkholderia bryophila]
MLRSDTFGVREHHVFRSKTTMRLRNDDVLDDCEWLLTVHNVVAYVQKERVDNIAVLLRDKNISALAPALDFQSLWTNVHADIAGHLTISLDADMAVV